MTKFYLHANWQLPDHLVSSCCMVRTSRITPMYRLNMEWVITLFLKV